MHNPSIRYPRRVLPRTIARYLGRALLPLFFNIQKEGVNLVPKSGPLIVVSNHSAIMEVVLLVVYLPRVVEILGSIDIPHEPLNDHITRFYGYIPYRRGFLERTPLRQALSILEQGGVLGIFPEGGIWQISERRVQPGVAWLSEKSQAPVLPIYFHGTPNAIHKALNRQRPTLSMKIGALIPAETYDNRGTHKQFLQEFSHRIMDAVNALRPPNLLTRQEKILDESFSLGIELINQDLQAVEIPGELKITHPNALAKFLHYPTILKIFKVNYRMPVDPLQELASRPMPASIVKACEPILNYLENENPYFLTYRFGQREGTEIKMSLDELSSLAKWADENRFNLYIAPVRNYFDVETGRVVTQTEQETFINWM